MGTANLTATYGTKSTTITVDVDSTLKLELDKQSLLLKKNAAGELKLTATYADGKRKISPIAPSGRPVTKISSKFQRKTLRDRDWRSEDLREIRGQSRCSQYRRGSSAPLGCRH